MLSVSSESKCRSYILSRVHWSQVPHLRSIPCSSGMLDLVHTDVCGPIEISSVGAPDTFSHL